jgi:hypothetical protein
VGRGTSEDAQRRWSESRALLKQASNALKAGRVDEALRLFTKAHDLGDDNAICHARGHWGRAHIELRAGKLRAALLDAFFGALALVVSPIRRLSGARGRGFGPICP